LIFEEGLRKALLCFLQCITGGLIRDKAQCKKRQNSDNHQKDDVFNNTAVPLRLNEEGLKTSLF
jgi:hypothetical protein